MTKSERGMVANIYYNINHTPASWRLRRLVADDFEDALERDCRRRCWRRGLMRRTRMTRMSSCEFQPVCATMPRTTQPNKQAASVLSIPSRPIAQRKEPSMRLFPNATMPCVWWQEMYASCYAVVSVFCGIIREVRQTPYKTTAPGADNTKRGLTIATYVGGARL